ncbi:MAG: energy transducer TonB [Treponema sp.]
MSPLKPAARTKRRFLTAIVFALLVTLHIPLVLNVRFSPKTNYNAVSKSGNHVVMSIRGSTAQEKQKKKTKPTPQKPVQENRTAKVIEKVEPEAENTPEPIAETFEEEADESVGGTGALESAYAEGIEDVRMKIAEQIQKHKLYPMAARKRALEGDVELSFTVLADGTVQELRVLKDDVNALLKDAAILSVKKALPFKVNITAPLPMKITLRYELSG